MTTVENAPILPALTANERGADRGWPDAEIKALIARLKKRGEAFAAMDPAAREPGMAQIETVAAMCLEGIRATHAAEIAAAVQAEREALLRDIPATDGLMPDEVGGFLKGLLAYQLAIRARGTTDAKKDNGQ